MLGQDDSGDNVPLGRVDAAEGEALAPQVIDALYLAVGRYDDHRLVLRPPLSVDVPYQWDNPIPHPRLELAPCTYGGKLHHISAQIFDNGPAG